jgi:hypothetical protein
LLLPSRDQCPLVPVAETCHHLRTSSLRQRRRRQRHLVGATVCHCTDGLLSYEAGGRVEALSMLGNCFVMSRCVCWIGCGWSWPAQFALKVQTCRKKAPHGEALVLMAVFQWLKVEKPSRRREDGIIQMGSLGVYVRP